MGKVSRIEQYETVLYDANLNPLGIPASVKQSIANNISSIIKYPDMYYTKLRTAIADYAGTELVRVTIGNGSPDLLRLFTSIIHPKKALLLSPCGTEYEKVLRFCGSEISYFDLPEENEFLLSVEALIEALDPSLDILVIGNPNNPTSKRITRDEIRQLLEACREKGIFLIVDEMYVEFLDDYEEVTAVPLTEEFPNLAVLRSVSKFFAVPGLRFAYAVMKNDALSKVIDQAITRNNIATLSAIAGVDMFKDTAYIENSRSVIHTERSLVYLAMKPCRSIRLYKPEANFMLVRLLKDGLTSSEVAEHCSKRGIMIRRCDDMRGLSNQYIRFCFMNPRQNDLMVNTILEIV
ncbi:MAG: aminotransferase class I/II-fold pyridoxal phosphate-dependent enzyme [Eubacterium sp.]|nr:aminotransferase class I/II-fold pyridoxal phosphate-dependent enzyme [Eubacterium sp.]